MSEIGATQPSETRIGTIDNYYGGLYVKAEDGKFFWSIECYSGHYWDEIPERLYRALVDYETSLNTPPPPAPPATGTAD